MRMKQYLRPPDAPNPPLAEIAGNPLYEVVIAERNMAVLEATIQRKREWLENCRHRAATSALYRRVEEIKDDIQELEQELMLNETRLGIARLAYDAFQEEQERQAS